MNNLQTQCKERSAGGVIFRSFMFYIPKENIEAFRWCFAIIKNNELLFHHYSQDINIKKLRTNLSHHMTLKNDDESYKRQ